MAPPTLIYFALPGRAEVARLLFTLAGAEFVDKRLTFDEWRGAEGDALKGKLPFGQLPVLQLDDGTVLAQSAAIDRYVAATTGQLPASDPLAVAKADQLYFFAEDVWMTVYPSFRLADTEAKIKARQELLAEGGALKAKLDKLEAICAAKKGTKFLTGDTLTHGDLALFCGVSTLQSGWLDGIPTDLLSSFPAIKAFREAVASVPAIKAFYDAAAADDSIRRTGFRAAEE